MLVHQLAYIKSHEMLSYGEITFIKLSNVIYSLRVKKNLFHPKKSNEELLDPEIP